MGEEEILPLIEKKNVKNIIFHSISGNESKKNKQKTLINLKNFMIYPPPSPLNKKFTILK